MRTALALCLLLGACASTPLGTAGLIGPEWQATRISGTAASGTAPTVAFTADGRVSGDAGCNLFSGPYTLAGSQLVVGPLISTRRACADAARTAQETRFLAALQAAATVQMSEMGVTLTGSGGEIGLSRRGG